MHKFQIQLLLATTLAIVCISYVVANNCPTPTDKPNFISSPKCSGTINRGKQVCNCRCANANNTKAQGYYCQPVPTTVPTTATTKATTTAGASTTKANGTNDTMNDIFDWEEDDE